MTHSRPDPVVPEELIKVREYLCRLARLVTKPAEYGFQMIRRDRDDGSIEYQIVADTKGNGGQIAWVQSSRHDAEFITACLAQAPLFSALLAAPVPQRQHRCSGCGHRWEGTIKGAELCGDCWRKGQAEIFAAVPPRQEEKADQSRVEGYRCSRCNRAFYVAGNEEAYVCPTCGERSIWQMVGPFSVAALPPHQDADRRT